MSAVAGGTAHTCSQYSSQRAAAACVTASAATPSDVSNSTSSQDTSQAASSSATSLDHSSRGVAISRGAGGEPILQAMTAAISALVGDAGRELMSATMASAARSAIGLVRLLDMMTNSHMTFLLGSTTVSKYFSITILQPQSSSSAYVAAYAREKTENDQPDRRALG